MTQSGIPVNLGEVHFESKTRLFDFCDVVGLAGEQFKVQVSEDVRDDVAFLKMAGIQISRIQEMVNFHKFLSYSFENFEA